MKVAEFIENVLINEVKQLQHHPYLFFCAMAQGIEFLGACLDDKYPFEERRSKPRFNNAIRVLFQKYEEYNRKKCPYKLLENLRNGLLHRFRPGPKLGLINQKESKEYKINHLEIDKTDRLILVSEEFFKDFKKACKEIIRLINSKELTHSKVQDEPFLFVPGDIIPPESGGESPDGTISVSSAAPIFISIRP
jgi:hypothetical protein